MKLNVALLILIAGCLVSFAFLLGNYEGHIAKAECEAALPRDQHCKLIAVPEVLMKHMGEEHDS